MKIEKVHIEEIQLLKKIAKQTFINTYSSVNTEENLNVYLEKSFSTEVLNSQLKNKDSEFFFAKQDKIIVGYLKVNIGESQTNPRNPNALEIERIYVLKEFQGKRIGQKLYKKAIEIANEKCVEYIWLGVWEHNLKAIRFYQKNGFMEYDKHIFKLGNEKQIDLMMKLKLNE